MHVTALQPGRIVDDFLIEKQIGVGGQGIVYKARQISLDRMVAIKMLGAPSTNPADLKRFRFEAQTVARLNHPNIARIHYIGQNDEFQYLVQEFVDGIPLRTVINTLQESDDPTLTLDTVFDQTETVLEKEAFRFAVEHTQKNPTLERLDSATIKRVREETEREAIDYSPLSPIEQTQPDPTPVCLKKIRAKSHIRKSIEMIIGVAEALDHAHKKGILHLDIKPENIMLDRDGGVRLIDFGLARFLNDESRFFTSAMNGTPHYLAPEQLRPKLGIDSRAEQFSLGLVLYELLSIRRAVSAVGVQEAMFSILTKNLTPLRNHNSAVSEGVGRVVHKMTAKEPSGRYQTMRECIDELKAALEGRRVNAPKYSAKIHRRELLENRPVVIGWAGLAASISAGIMSFLAIPTLMIAQRADARRFNSSVDPRELFRNGVAYGAVGAALAVLARLSLTGRKSAFAFAVSSAVLVSLAAIARTLDSGAEAVPWIVIGVFGITPTFVSAIALSLRESRKWIDDVEKLRQEYGTNVSIQNSETTKGN